MDTMIDHHATTLLSDRLDVPADVCRHGSYCSAKMTGASIFASWDSPLSSPFPLLPQRFLTLSSIQALSLPS